MHIQLAETDDEIHRCAPVMRQLRPHIDDADFVEIVRKQQAGGYHLAYVDDGGRVTAVGG
jgi:hypothetical protein